MRSLEIDGKTGHSKIFVGKRLADLPALLPDTKTVIITDHHVAGYYQDGFPACHRITIGTGEGIKTLDTVADIYNQLIFFEADRSAFLVGIGGGIVCDITGFVASTYLRGVRFGYVATTLLAQVDAGVGGKTGVNFTGYKNMVGVFNQPEFVICDPHVLKTLPGREISCGFAEIVKHAAIADADYFAFLEREADKALLLVPEVLERVVHNSVAIKADIVNRDETEKGERRKLNFGHTIGHAVEKTTGIPHGEAVSIGMMAAAAISQARGLLAQNEVDRLGRLLTRFNLPVKMNADPIGIIDAIRKDKKRQGDAIHLVLLSGIGRTVIKQVGLTELGRVISMRTY